MVARITRLLLLFQLLVAIGVSIAADRIFHVGNSFIAVLAGMTTVVLVRLLITCNNFFLAWRFRSVTPEHHHIRAWQAVKLFFGEFRATMTASSWTMPFRFFTTVEASKPEGLPVLLIHGYGCNSGYWRPLSKALQAANITHRAVDLEPVIGGIDDYVPMVHEAVETLCRETGFDKIVIVAHSMGGLVTRAYLRDHGPRRVAKAITLGTPHHGTGLAHFGVGLNTHQMRWTATEQEGVASDWLLALKAGEDPTIYRLFVSIYSHHDNIISPQTSSHLDGAKNIELNGVGHVALAFDPAVQALVIEEVKASAAVTEPAAAGPLRTKASRIS